jgi:hypothetical protein
VAPTGPFKGDARLVRGRKSGDFAGGKWASRHVCGSPMCNAKSVSNATLRGKGRLGPQGHTQSVSFGETKIMLEGIDGIELDVIPPINSLTITLDVSPPELELAVATRGVSLCNAMMRAIVAAMVVDAGWATQP